jgi:hypothetical protein
MKRSAEQEAYRISRVQASLKGHPPTELQRKARAEGLRKAWAEGRIKPNSTPQSIKKTADKLRGRKRPADVIARIAKSNTGKKRTPEQIEAFRQIQIAGRAAGKYKSSPEGAERRRLAAIAAHLGIPRTEEQKRRHSDIMRGRKAKPEHVEKRIAPMIGREQKAILTAKGPTNHGSIEGVLRDAKGRIWHFRNLTHFVRTHQELFDPNDLVMRPVGRGRRQLYCNAAKRLLQLFKNGKNTLATWKGWTVAFSIMERAEGGGDLLGRDYATVVELAK